MLKKILLASIAAASVIAAPHKVTFDADGVAEIDGQKMFPLSLAVLPMPDAKAPDGKSAWQEFNDGGINLVRVTPKTQAESVPGAKPKPSMTWTPRYYELGHEYFAALTPAHLFVWLWTGEELGHFNASDTAKVEKMKKLIETFKDEPAMFGWKGEDEPLWANMNVKKPGMRPPASLAEPYKLVHELDPNHPMIVMQAPRGTAAENAAYDPYLDITGMDIFPVGYPPGGHVPTWPNKEISMAGDWTKISVEAARGKPVWMTLQISWSGVGQPGKTLRYPDFTQERFMTYQTIINGARGINWFGGGSLQTLNERDRALGFNWTFWDRILKPLLAELNEKSPLHEALVAPNSKLPVRVQGGEGMEFVVREVGNEIFILACKREGKTVEVKFTGLPAGVSGGEVVYEDPRKVVVKNGAFSDWFAPFDVHVYRFKR